ncbi:MAG: anti-sigma factor antagonist [Ilumatobacteraceae bacterium]|jgi:anti-sigma B factor antagonist
MEDSSSLTNVPSSPELSSCTVDVETTGSYVVVTVVGELDMADADQVAQVLVEAANAGRPILRVELSGLTFADSSAIKAIILGAKAAEEHGVTYELVNPHGRVQRLLQVTGLNKALNVVYEPQYVEGPNSL